MGTLRQLSLGDLADDGREEEREREEEEKIMPSLMATSLRWRTHSARTNYLQHKVYCTTNKLHTTYVSAEVLQRIRD